jgi:hypothetical protein
MRASRGVMTNRLDKSKQAPGERIKLPTGPQAEKLCEEFGDTIASELRNPNALSAYLYAWRNFLKSCGERDLDPFSIRGAHVRAWIAAFKALGSDQKFKALFAALSDPRKDDRPADHWSDPKGRRIVRVERGLIRTKLFFDAKLGPRCGEHVIENRSKLYSDFKSRGGED